MILQSSSQALKRGLRGAKSPVLQREVQCSPIHFTSTCKRRYYSKHTQPKRSITIKLRHPRYQVQSSAMTSSAMRSQIVLSFSMTAKLYNSTPRNFRLVRILLMHSKHQLLRLWKISKTTLRERNQTTKEGEHHKAMNPYHYPKRTSVQLNMSQTYFLLTTLNMYTCMYSHVHIQMQNNNPFNSLPKFLQEQIMKYSALGTTSEEMSHQTNILPCDATAKC